MTKFRGNAAHKANFPGVLVTNDPEFDTAARLVLLLTTQSEQSNRKQRSTKIASGSWLLEQTRQPGYRLVNLYL